jgi:tetraacyldisaccharide 4'-kinase
MRAPAFWWRPPGLAATLLSPAGAIYGCIAAARMKRAGERAAVPVICVGNATLGGAGKTPAAIALAHILQDMGERPCLLSRGYGGRARGPLRVDPQTHDARAVGDEVILLARAFPTIVARDRAAGARLAVGHGASVVVLDDGFQNPALEKDLSLLVVDGAVGVGNGRVFPAGPLRAALRPQLERAQGLVRVGEGIAGDAVAHFAAFMRIPVFRARLVPDPATTARLSGERVLAFAGIGHPDKFFATLAETGAQIVERRPFADHHRFTSNEAQSLMAAAVAHKLRLVTTEKDAARMSAIPALAELAAAAVALPVRLAFEDAAAMRELLKGAFAKARSAST